MVKKKNSPNKNGQQQTDMTNVEATSEDKITILRKALHYSVYSIPVVLLAAFVLTSLYSALFKSDKVFFAKKPIVIVDTANCSHYIGAGNQVSIVNNATLILQNDTIETGDSLIALICNQYMSNKEDPPTTFFANKEEINNEKDSVIVAVVKKDLALRSKDNKDILYARAGERFLYRDSVERGDTVSILFNEIVFRTKAGELKLDTISTADYNSMSVPFELTFAIRDNNKQQFAVRTKPLKENETDDSIGNTSFSVYPINKDNLLCKIQKADTTYLFETAATSGTPDSMKLRVACRHLSYVLVVPEAVTLVVDKKSLRKNPLCCTSDWSIIFFGLLVLSLIILAIYAYFRKQDEELADDNGTVDKEGKIKGLTEKIKQLETEIEKYDASSIHDQDATINIKEKKAELEQARVELSKLQSSDSMENDDDSADPDVKEEIESLQKIIESLKGKNQDLTNKLTVTEEKLSRLKQNMDEEISKAKEKAKQEADERIRKAEERARREAEEANRRAQKAEERADAAEKKSREIRQEVTEQFKAEIQRLNNEIQSKQNTIVQTAQELNRTRGELGKKEQECLFLSRDLQNKTEALKGYAARITDVQPAGAYAKFVLKLLQIGHSVEKAADKLLEKGIDDYLLSKYITRYQKALHQLDMDQFSTDVLNIANVQFVYKQQPLAKYDQHDLTQFKESMKLFFFESYLGKYINALMVFNETMAGLHHLVDGLTEHDTTVFAQFRNELGSIFKDLEIEVHSVKIFDSITDNVDLSVKMRPLEFDCPSGTICQIDSCLVYLAGGNKPNDKIHVIVKE